MDWMIRLRFDRLAATLVPLAFPETAAAQAVQGRPAGIRASHFDPPYTPLILIVAPALQLAAAMAFARHSAYATGVPNNSDYTFLTSRSSAVLDAKTRRFRRVVE